MEALNASSVVLKPISVLKQEPKKHSTIPHFKFSKPQIHGTSSLLLISSVFNSAFAKALTYEEALNQSTTASESSFSAPDVDVTGVIDSIINFGVDNPAVLAGAASVLALPLILSQVSGKSNKPWGVQTAKTAYEKLGDDGNAQLLDIRPNSEIRAVGSPDIRGLKKKPVTVAYNGDDKQGFLKKLALKFKEPENTTLFILDKFDGSSELVAELVTVNGFKAAYAIKDGAEGPRGYLNSGLPWILPKKSFAFDFSSLTDAFGEGSEAVSVILGIAVATGLGVLAFTEVETILEVLGSAALVQLVSKKLLYAEDRKKTLAEFNEFVSTKIGPSGLIDEIKDIGKALLPPVTSKTLPAPAAATKEAVVEPTPPEVQPEAATPAPVEVQPEAATPAPVEAQPEAATPAPVEAQPEAATPAADEPPPQVNDAVPKIEVKEEEAPLPKPARSLSPYPYYPDFKPPTSPIPSKP